MAQQYLIVKQFVNQSLTPQTANPSSSAVISNGQITLPMNNASLTNTASGKTNGNTAVNVQNCKTPQLTLIPILPTKNLVPNGQVNIKTNLVQGNLPLNTSRHPQINSPVILVGPHILKAQDRKPLTTTKAEPVLISNFIPNNGAQTVEKVNVSSHISKIATNTNLMTSGKCILSPITKQAQPNNPLQKFIQIIPSTNINCNTRTVHIKPTFNHVSNSNPLSTKTTIRTSEVNITASNNATLPTTSTNSVMTTKILPLKVQTKEEPEVILEDEFPNVGFMSKTDVSDVVEIKEETLDRNENTLRIVGDYNQLVKEEILEPSDDESVFDTTEELEELIEIKDDPDSFDIQLKDPLQDEDIEIPENAIIPEVQLREEEEMIKIEDDADDKVEDEWKYIKGEGKFVPQVVPNVQAKPSLPAGYAGNVLVQYVKVNTNPLLQKEKSFNHLQYQYIKVSDNPPLYQKVFCNQIKNVVKPLKLTQRNNTSDRVLRSSSKIKTQKKVLPSQPLLLLPTVSTGNLQCNGTTIPTTVNCFIPNNKENNINLIKSESAVPQSALKPAIPSKINNKTHQNVLSSQPLLLLPTVSTGNLQSNGKTIPTTVNCLISNNKENNVNLIKSESGVPQSAPAPKPANLPAVFTQALLLSGHTKAGIPAGNVANLTLTVKSTEPPLYNRVICKYPNPNQKTVLLSQPRPILPASTSVKTENNNGQNKIMTRSAARAVAEAAKPSYNPKYEYQYVKVSDNPRLYKKVLYHKGKILETILSSENKTEKIVKKEKPSSEKNIGDYKIMADFWNSLDEHRRRKCDKKPKPRPKPIVEYRCPHCDYKTRHMRNVKRHESMHQRRGIHWCTFCGYKARSLHNLCLHFEVNHPGLTPFKCKECDFKTTRHSTLATHMIKHKIMPTLYSCNLCNYKTVWKSSIKKHYSTVHSSDKLFACILCEFRTNTKESLNGHMRIHSSEKPCICPFCSYRTRSKSTLKVHIRQHSGEKPYVCTLCDYRAAQCVSLKLHMRRHLGHFDYPCTMCKYKTVDARSLKVHMKIHSVFTCYHCNFKVRSIRKLRSHIIKNHLPRKLR